MQEALEERLCQQLDLCGVEVRKLIKQSQKKWKLPFLQNEEHMLDLEAACMAVYTQHQVAKGMHGRRVQQLCGQLEKLVEERIQRQQSKEEAKRREDELSARLSLYVVKAPELKKKSKALPRVVCCHKGIRMVNDNHTVLTAPTECSSLFESYDEEGKVRYVVEGGRVFIEW